MAQTAKVNIVCPVCGSKIKTLKVGEKIQGGEVTTTCCQEKVFTPKVLVLEPVKDVPPPEED